MSDLSTLSDEELDRLIAAKSGDNPLAALSDAELDAMIAEQSQGQPKPAPQPDTSGMPKTLLGSMPNLYSGGMGVVPSVGAEITPEYAAGQTQALKNSGKGFAKGMGDIGRGIGFMDQLTPEQQAEWKAFAAANPEATVGEIAGQVAPFLIPAGLIGNIASTPWRIAASGLMGGTEAGLITRGTGGTNTEALASTVLGLALGISAESAIPLYNRVYRSVADKLGVAKGTALFFDDLTPTPEFKRQLDANNLSMDDLNDQAFNQARASSSAVDPESAARRARFEAQGVTPTTGQVTQSFDDIADEQALKLGAGPEAEAMRIKELEQSNQFETSVRTLVDELKMTDDAGQSIKDALMGRKKLLRDEKNKLYKQAADAAPEVLKIPLFTDEIRAALPNAAWLKRNRRAIGNQIDEVDDLMVEFGIDQTPEKVAKFVEDGGEVTPLTIGNFDELRQALNLIDASPENSGRVKMLTGGLKSALDDEGEFITAAAKEAGITDAGVLDTLSQARDVVRTMKTEFSPQSITGRLINDKKDGVTDVIYASKVTEKLLGTKAPIEELRATLSSLNKAGAPGRQAINDLQSSTVMKVLNASLKANTNKLGDKVMFTPNAFVAAMDDIGDEKLALIFRGNEAALSRLKRMKLNAFDMTPPANAKPKGSASWWQRQMGRIGKLTIIRDFVEAATYGGDRAALNKAFKGDPKRLAYIDDAAGQYPALATALGVGALVNTGEENE